MQKLLPHRKLKIYFKITEKKVLYKDVYVCVIQYYIDTHTHPVQTKIRHIKHIKKLLYIHKKQGKVKHFIKISLGGLCACIVCTHFLIMPKLKKNNLDFVYASVQECTYRSGNEGG